MLEALSKIASKTVDVAKNIATAILTGFGSSASRITPSYGSGFDDDGGNISKKTSSVKLLGEIYNLLVKTREEELLRRAQEQKNYTKELTNEEKRNRALIKALSVKRKVEKKETLIQKREKTEQKQTNTKQKQEEKQTKSEQRQEKREEKKQDRTTEKEKKQTNERVKKEEVKQTADKQKVETKQKKVEEAPKAAPAKPEVKPPTAEKVIIGAAAVTGMLAGREALASNISKYESGKAGYNAYNKGTVGNKMIPSDKPIDFSKMTISEYLRRGALETGDPDRLFAVGRYQIIPKTMRGLIEKLKIDPEKTYLDPPTQDLLFTKGLTKALRKQVDDYITGKSDDKDAAILELAKEFASVGVPYDMQVGKKQLKKGDSYYSGVGGNKAHNSPEEVGAALDADRAKNLKQDNKTNLAPISDTGTQINLSSIENKDLKGSLQSKKPIIIDSGTSVSSSSQPTTQNFVTVEETDDSSPLNKKRKYK